MKTLKVVVWGENVHEHENPKVRAIYPRGMHEAIAAGLRPRLPNAEISTATLQESQHGLTEERLANTDVLTWWGHMAHDKVKDDVVERVQKRVLEGMTDQNFRQWTKWTVLTTGVIYLCGGLWMLATAPRA